MKLNNKNTAVSLYDLINLKTFILTSHLYCKHWTIEYTQLKILLFEISCRTFKPISNSVLFRLTQREKFQEKKFEFQFGGLTGLNVWTRAITVNETQNFTEFELGFSSHK